MQIATYNTQLMSVLYFEDFLYEVPYYFQLEYDGECSNILKVSITEGDLHYELIEGDRDGGDRGEQQPPTVTLPPDQPDQTPPLGTTRPEENTPQRRHREKPYQHQQKHSRQTRRMPAIQVPPPVHPANRPGTAPFRISSAAQDIRKP